MKNEEILDLYLEEILRSGRNFNRRDVELRRYLDFCSQNYDGYIKYESVKGWLEHRRNSLNLQSLATVQNRISDFAGWAKLLNKSIEPIPRAKRLKIDRRRPVIIKKSQIVKFIQRQRSVPSRKGINPITFSTITGLLYTTGLRVGEALNLRLDHLDLKRRSIYVSGGKGIADRTIWFSVNTQTALENYHKWRLTYGRNSTRFFIYDKVDTKGPYAIYLKNFQKIASEEKLRSAKSGRHRSNFIIHDLRHSYTVNALINIYKSNLNIHECIIELSATLGHKSLNHTYWYVEQVPELTDAACRRMLK